MTLTFGSLFAGIGGIDLGLERAGMTCKWQVEIDPFCQKVLAKHWPNVARYSDVREVGKHNLEPVDLIAGGFPCQPHSLAGKRKGAEDDRNLWPEYLRIIRELNPTWVLAENVPGIITTSLDQVLSDLESENYQTRTLIVPACAFDAPHIRERIWIVAHSNSSAVRKQRNDEKAGNEPDHRNIDVSNPNSSGRETRGELWKRGGQPYPGGTDEDVPHSESLQRPSIERNEQVGILPIVSNACRPGFSTPQQKTIQREGRRQERGAATECDWWSVEPDVGRVADGVPSRVDRLRALGNAVVPQVVEWIGRMIVNPSIISNS
jgi:DNA (cytosine-5)-methyltransferase 1